MTTYVLIAGAWHGSWCWSEVAPLLEASGHRVLTPDLLEMDGGDAAAIANPLAVWADQIADLIRREADPVVLVGHSRAGLVISEVAERVPEKVDLLIYLCAFLLRDGQTLQEIAQQADNAAVFASAMVYVECLRDRAIPIATQRKMQAALPCSRSVQLDTDHSPFFSAPTALVAAIEELSASR